MANELRDIVLDDIEIEIDQAFTDETEGILGNLTGTPEAENRGEAQAEIISPRTPTQPTVEEASTRIPRIRIRTPATDSRVMATSRATRPPPPPHPIFGSSEAGRNVSSSLNRPTMSNPNPNSATTANTNNTVVIGGVTITVAQTEKRVDETTTAFYPKAGRELLTGDKLTDLFIKAVAESQKKYDFINLEIEDPEMLTDTYNLEMAIDKTKSNHTRFDMHDVFTIIDPDNGFKETDLYTSHSTLTEADVAKSNQWYMTMTEDPHNKWFRQNMKLTYEYFINNVEEKLAMKVKETYMNYPVKQRGGPLFFKIMIDILQNNSSEAAQYLISTVKNINISTYDGENVNEVVSLIRGATNRLNNLSSSKKDLIPEDFLTDIIKIFQTTSVPEFNNLFTYYSHASEVNTFLMGASAPTVTIEQILKFAEIQYRKFSQSGKWTGATTKLTETSFFSKAANKCFNCGGDHHLSQCTVPKNDARIKANYKLFQNNKKKVTASISSPQRNTPSSSEKKRSGKFAPPTAAEKANNNRRIIDGKEHFYFWKGRRWKPVKKSEPPKAASVAENVQTGATSTTSLTEVNRNKKAEEMLQNLKTALMAQLNEI